MLRGVDFWRTGSESSSLFTLIDFAGADLAPFSRFGWPFLEGVQRIGASLSSLELIPMTVVLDCGSFARVAFFSSIFGLAMELGLPEVSPGLLIDDLALLLPLRP